jgi:hypothetical protein
MGEAVRKKYGYAHATITAIEAPSPETEPQE